MNARALLLSIHPLFGAQALGNLVDMLQVQESR